MDNPSRRVVIVLGSGRSGTSLLMQILAGMGMQVSNNLIAANVSNPEGFFEDLDFKDIQAELYSCLNVSASMPLPENWIDTDCAKRAKASLHASLQRLLAEKTGILGLKDPRISTLLPLWLLLFNPLRVVPRYILAVRDPRSVVASFVRQYKTPGHTAELIWLLRTVGAIENTRADCFIAHYENWFVDPRSLAQRLLHFTGLDQSYKGDTTDVIAQVVKPKLDRASMGDYQIGNPYVLKLYAALQECHGAEFDLDRLMAVVEECREALASFRGWYELAHQTKEKLAATQARLNKAIVEAEKVKLLEARIQALEAEKIKNIQYFQAVKKLQRQFRQVMS